MHVKSLTVIVVSLMLLCGCFSDQNSDSKELKSNTKELSFKESDLISGVREGRLYVMFDLFPYEVSLKSLSDSILHTTVKDKALEEVKRLLSKKEHKELTEGVLDFVLLKERDEYGDRDFSKTTRLGKIFVRKSSEGIRIVEDSLKIRF